MFGGAGVNRQQRTLALVYGLMWFLALVFTIHHWWFVWNLMALKFETVDDRYNSFTWWTIALTNIVTIMPISTLYLMYNNTIMALFWVHLAAHIFVVIWLSVNALFVVGDVVNGCENILICKDPCFPVTCSTHPGPDFAYAIYGWHLFVYIILGLIYIAFNIWLSRQVLTRNLLYFSSGMGGRQSQFAAGEYEQPPVIPPSSSSSRKPISYARGERTLKF